jgi:hypothetical protein
VAIALGIETQEAGEVTLFGVDRPFRLAGHLGAKMPLGQRQQTGLRVSGPGHQNLSLENIS